MGFFDKLSRDIYRAYKLNYYIERNREYRKRDQERRNKQLKKEREELEKRKEYAKNKERLDDMYQAFKDIQHLTNNINYLYCPSLYQKHEEFERKSLYDLEREAYFLRSKSSKYNFKEEHYTEYWNLENSIKKLKEMIEESKTNNKEEIKTENKPQANKINRDNISDPKIYYGLMREINKGFKNEQAKMKMIKKIGASGLSTEERKHLISMIR